MITNTAFIRLAQIDLQDRAFKISTEQSLSGLVTSIAEIGLIHPPFLIHRKASSYSIVSGFRRVQACRDLGWSEIPVRLLPADASPLSVLSLAVADNAQHRELNLLEQARTVEKLASFFPSDIELAAYSGCLGLSFNQELVSRLKRINQLSSPILDCIRRGCLSLTIALELGKLEVKAGEALARLFEEIRPTLNQQKEICSLLRDIACAEDRLISDLLETGEMHAILFNKDYSRQQKLKHVRSFLHKRRYPWMSRFEKAFEENRRALMLPHTIAFKAAPGFEAQEFSICLSFQTVTEFADQIQTLERLPDNPHFDAIINKRFADSDSLY